MANWGGIIGAALAGGVTGYANAMVNTAALGVKASFEQQRDEFLAQKQERLQQLMQQFQSAEGEKTRTFTAGESQKTREFTGTENALNRGQQEQMHQETLAHSYSSDASRAQQHTETLKSQEKIAATHEAGANKRNADTIAASNSSVQVLDDGRLAVTAVKDGKRQVVDYLRDPGTGEALKSNKDLSGQEKIKVESLVKLIKEHTDILAKPTIMQDDVRIKIESQITQYQRELSKILGIELGPPARAVTSGSRKPLSSFMGNAE